MIVCVTVRLPVNWTFRESVGLILHESCIDEASIRYRGDARSSAEYVLVTR